MNHSSVSVGILPASINLSHIAGGTINWFYSHIAVSPCCPSPELTRRSSKRIMAFNDDRRLSVRPSVRPPLRTFFFLSFRMSSTFPLARRTPTEHRSPSIGERGEQTDCRRQGVRRIFLTLTSRKHSFFWHVLFPGFKACSTQRISLKLS